MDSNTDAGVYFTFTERGIERYGENTLDEFFETMEHEQLGDISFNIAGFQFDMTSVIVKRLMNPEIQVQLNEKLGFGNVVLRNMYLGLTFEFMAEEHTFPYLKDSGTGTLSLDLDTLRMELRASENEDCPGQLHYTSSASDSRVNSIGIHFDSPLSYIYDALLPILENYLVDMFNTKLGPQFAEMLIDLANTRMATIDPISSVSNETRVLEDERWIGDVSIGDRIFTIGTSGLSGYYDETKWTYTSGREYEPVAPPSYLLNNDIQYFISRNALDSALEYIWLLNSKEIRDALGIEDLELRVEEIVKTGVKIHVEYTRGGIPRSFMVSGPLLHKQHEQRDRDLVVAWFRPSANEIVDFETEEQQFGQRVVDFLATILDDYAFTVTNGYNIDIAGGTVVYVNADWVVVGANIRPDE